MNAEERQIYFEGFKQGKKDTLEMCKSCKYKVSTEDIKQIRVNVIDECISTLNEYASIPQLTSAISFLIGGLEQLKAQNK